MEAILPVLWLFSRFYRDCVCLESSLAAKRAASLQVLQTALAYPNDSLNTETACTELTDQLSNNLLSLLGLTSNVSNTGISIYYLICSYLLIVIPMGTMSILE